MSSLHYIYKNTADDDTNNPLYHLSYIQHNTHLFLYIIINYGNLRSGRFFLYKFTETYKGYKPDMLCIYIKEKYIREKTNFLYDYKKPEKLILYIIQYTCFTTFSKKNAFTTEIDNNVSRELFWYINECVVNLARVGDFFFCVCKYAFFMSFPYIST